MLGESEKNIDVKRLTYTSKYEMGAWSLIDTYVQERWKSSHLMVILEGVAW